MPRKPAPSLWTRAISARRAWVVGKALRAAGYSITNPQVRSLGSAIKIAYYLEPGDAAARLRALDLICVAAQFQPPKPPQAPETGA